MKESDLQVMVANYLVQNYPEVLFHSDFGSGIKLTQGQAMKQKRQNGGRRGWPDMCIAEPRYRFHALFIELKKDGTRIYKKDGSFASPHIKEQWEMLVELACRGYKAEFAVGFEQAKKIIDDYLGCTDGEAEF